MKHIEQIEVPRDRFGRPNLMGKSYTRASTLAKVLDDQSNLIGWSSRMTALGMAKSPDLIGLASTTKPDDRRTLDDIVERAKDRAGAGSGRDMGTSIHSVTEMLDYGDSVDAIPADLRNDALAYRSAYQSLGMTPVAAECFVVNDHLDAAGSFDRLMKSDDGYVITDIKTGTKDDPKYAVRYSGLAWSIQLAIYAHARPWNEYLLNWTDWGFEQPRIDYGVIWYIPRNSAKCYAIRMDLSSGLWAAGLAKKVRDARKLKFHTDIREAVIA